MLAGLRKYTIEAQQLREEKLKTWRRTLEHLRQVVGVGEEPAQPDRRSAVSVTNSR
jgi:hypothetical protein